MPPGYCCYIAVGIASLNGRSVTLRTKSAVKGGKLTPIPSSRSFVSPVLGADARLQFFTYPTYSGYTEALYSAHQCNPALWSKPMLKIRSIASAIIAGAAMIPALALAAGNNAADTKRAEGANLPVCSPDTKGDCHVHSRETYLQLRPARPDPNKQPHAWWEYDRQQRESAELSRE